MAVVAQNATAISDALTFGTALTALTNTSSPWNPYSVLSGSLDNTPSGSRTSISYQNGLLRLTNTGSLATASSGSPAIVVLMFPLLDGSTAQAITSTTNYSPPNATQFIRQLPVSLTWSPTDFGDAGQGFALGPFIYQFQVINMTGVSWSGGSTMTLTLYRWNTQIV